MATLADRDEPDRPPSVCEGGSEPSDLLQRVYAQLRASAERRLHGERVGHTLTATALVHEAYLRLAEGRRVPWASEAHFYAAAAEAMRLILIEHARARGRAKRGGGRGRVPLSVVDLARCDDAEQILMLDEEIGRLALRHPTAGSVVRLRFYAGLSVEQTAAILGVSVRTVMREWSFARAVLYRALEADRAGGGGDE